QAIGALLAVQPVEQALRLEVDLVRAHQHGSVGEAGVRCPAQNLLPMVVLGIDPGLASTGYGVVARRGDRLVALDGGVMETGADSPRERRLAQLHGEVGA